MSVASQATSQIATLLRVGVNELDYLEGLGESGCEQLAADIRSAQVASREEVKRAGDEAISHLPKLLQKPLRKLFP